MSKVDDKAVQAGAAPYTAPFLHIYDLWVVHLSNDLAWRCGRERFVEMYDQHVGHGHLEVGPGSGWYLANAQLPAGTELTLLDLNANSLKHSYRRLSPRYDVRTVEANVLDPVPSNLGPFDSVGINYVVHCLPGGWHEKRAAFQNLAGVLAADGVLFGSTILGPGVKRNIFGLALSEAYNRLGAFHNRDDDYDGLVEALRVSFGRVEVSQVGNVALFVASKPKR
ncbi:MAG: class I SAM-dependent methyltransferase [Hyphomicrobiales bacterium]|nr:MAG: class I SAM-dependent methyltransferase [Hyphomicrobiales bacterium]